MAGLRRMTRLHWRALLACACGLAAATVAAPALAPAGAGPGPILAEADAQEPTEPDAQDLAEADAQESAEQDPTEPDAQEPAAPDVARQPAPRVRVAYVRWRKRLQRHDVYVGRNLLPQVRAAEGAMRPPTTAELRGAIHRMQRRWGRWLRHTARGRAVRFKLKVRHGVPRWGKRYLRNIARCESKANPSAVGGGGAYRGMYQFSTSTWYVVGGKGDPAAASRWEQTWRAWLLLRRHGSGHWPICG